MIIRLQRWIKSRLKEVNDKKQILAFSTPVHLNENAFLIDTYQAFKLIRQFIFN